MDSPEQPILQEEIDPRGQEDDEDDDEMYRSLALYNNT